MEKRKEVGKFAQQKAGVEDSKSNFQNIKQRKRAEIEGKVIKRESRERLVKGKRLQHSLTATELDRKNARHALIIEQHDIVDMRSLTM